MLSTIKQVLSYAVSRGDLKANPAAMIRARDSGGIEKPRERFLTIDKIKQLWRFLDESNHGISL